MLSSNFCVCFYSCVVVVVFYAQVLLIIILHKCSDIYVLRSILRSLLTTWNFAAWILIWSTITKTSFISGKMMKIT